MRPTVTLQLDTRFKLKSGKYALKIRVGLAKDENRRYGLNLSFTKAEYETLLKRRMIHPYKDTWKQIEAFIQKADTIIDGLMPHFNFKDFKARFSNDKSYRVIQDKSSLIYIMNIVNEQYLKNKRHSMTVNITNSVASILKFANHDLSDHKKRNNISLSALTPEFCRKYEDYMYKKSKAKTRNGAGINLRHIRILFNEAIARKFVPREWYPFKRGATGSSSFEDAYVIPYEEKVKQYLNESESVKLSEIKTFDTSSQQNAYSAYFISFPLQWIQCSRFSAI